MSDAAPDLSFIARQLRQLIGDVGGIKDDMTVLSAMVMRQDTTMSAVLNELRAMHSQHGRVANRVRDLETAVNEKLAP